MIHVLEVGSHSLTRPLMVSRGEVVYAVHEVTNGDTGSVLRYCRVSDIGYFCYYVSDYGNPTVSFTDAAAAVSSSGSLHVAWLVKNSLGVTTAERFDNNYDALNADMGGGNTIATGLLYPPAIAIETDDGYVYITIAYNNGIASDSMKLYFCQPASCPGSGGDTTPIMDPAKAWGFYNPPSITAGSDWAMVAFAANSTDDLTGSEIYTFIYTPFNPAPTPTRIYPTPFIYDCDPKAVLVNGWQTIGWHTCGFPPSRADIYVYSTGFGIQIIHPTSGYPGRGDIAMAANGEYVAGVWNEVQGDGRIATWLAFNSYLTWMPLVIR
jgi:hypothetical protein